MDPPLFRAFVLLFCVLMIVALNDFCLSSLWADCVAVRLLGAVSTSDTVHVTIETTTAVKPLSSLAGVTVYPNPVSDQLIIDWNIYADSNTEVEVINSFGQFQRVFQSNDTSRSTFDFSDLPTGIYYLKIHLGSDVYGHQVIKK